jgi:hypothetical protein
MNDGKHDGFTDIFVKFKSKFERIHKFIASLNPNLLEDVCKRKSIHLQHIHALLKFLDTPQKHWSTTIASTVLASVKALHFLHRVCFGGLPTLELLEAERQLQTNSECGREAAAVAQRPGGPPPLVEPSEDGPHQGGAEHTSPPEVVAAGRRRRDGGPGQPAHTKGDAEIGGKARGIRARPTGPEKRGGEGAGRTPG